VRRNPAYHVFYRECDSNSKFWACRVVTYQWITHCVAAT
jgi:hypothetical protein